MQIYSGITYKKTHVVSLILDSIDKLSEGGNLEQMEAEQLFLAILNGGVTPAQIASILTALKLKGEVTSEITGVARVLRSKMVKLPISKELKEKTIDTCGTGGDKKGTYNISTAVAIVVAACDVLVAKHGNRSVSSQSGSADVLKELGVNIELMPEQSAKCLEQAGICFLFAPLYHKAMAAVAPIRKELGIRTIFNIVGPLCNPAELDKQFMGVYSPKLLQVIPEVAKSLGYKKMMVVHGDDGSDEISICSKTKIAELENGEIKFSEINPEDFGFKIYPEDDLVGGDARENAKALRNTLKGEDCAYASAVILNAAAALKVAGKVASIKDGVKVAGEAISSGRAIKKLDRLVEISNALVG